MTAANAWAAPFTVHRASLASDVRAAAPRATVVVSPFDDSAGSLGDGLVHYYVVADVSGGAPAISVHKNVAQGAVRIAFDDGDPFGAAADAALSSVTAIPATAVADGVSTIELRIVPRDVGGTPLGTGLFVELDAFALWPAHVVGSVVDRGDGSYSVRIASSTAGSGSAAVAVEGVWLGSEPVFEFTDAGSASLRDQAIARLEKLGGSGGLFEELLNRFAGDANVFAALDAGLKDFEKALEDLDRLLDFKALDNRLADALDDFEDALGQLTGQDRDDLESLMDRLAESARMIAVHHIGVAESIYGSCDGAREKLDEGDDELTQSPPRHSAAVEKFAEAIASAVACG